MSSASLFRSRKLLCHLAAAASAAQCLAAQGPGMLVEA